MEAIKENLHQIKTQLLACHSEVNTSHIIEHQQAVNETQKQLQKFQQLISDQQQIISKASQPIDNTQSPLNQREELLVDMALGTDCKKKLEQVDREIETQKDQDQAASAANEKILAHAQQTVTGLERRKANVQAQLDRLNQLTPSLLDELATGLAEESAQQYKKAADAMGKALINLAVIDDFVAELGVRKDTGLFPKDRWFMKIPKLSSMNAEDGMGNSEHYFIDTHNGQLALNKELQQLKESLRKQGIELQ